MTLSRRSLLGLLAGGVAVPLAIRPAAAAEASMRFTNGTGLRHGSFVWQPSACLEGPVLIVATLDEQALHVFRGGAAIGIATCRISASAMSWPMGAFSVIGQHHGIASGRNGFDWDMAALHAESIATAKARQPLVRLSEEFAELLYPVTARGASLIICDQRSRTRVINHAAGLFSDESSRAALVSDIGMRMRRPAETADLPGSEASIVVAARDRKAYLIRAGRVEATTPVEIANPNTVLGTHVYALLGPSEDGRALRWLSFGMSRSAFASQVTRHEATVTLDRLRFPDANAATAMTRELGRGSMLYLTDAGAPASTRAERVEIELIGTASARGGNPAAEVARNSRRRDGSRTADADRPFDARALLSGRADPY